MLDAMFNLDKTSFYQECKFLFLLLREHGGMSWPKKIVSSGPPLNDFIPSCPPIDKHLESVKYCNPLKNGPN